MNLHYRWARSPPFRIKEAMSGSESGSFSPVHHLNYYYRPYGSGCYQLYVDDNPVFREWCF